MKKELADVGTNLVDEAIGDLIAGIHKKNGYGLIRPAEPFYGRLLAGIKRRICTENDKNKFWYVPTAAVGIEENQIILIVNIDFLKKFDRIARRAILKHEAQHIAHRHMFRFKEKNKMLGNIAMDAVINQYNDDIYEMVDDTGTKFEPVDHKKILDNGKPSKADQTWRYYYDLMIDQDQNQGQYQSQDQNQGQGQDQNQGQYQSQDQNQGQYQSQDQNQGQGQDQTKYGNIIDDHSFFGQEWGDSNRDLIEEKLKDYIAQCARQSYATNMPREIESILEDIRKESKIPWKTILRLWMKQSVKSVRELNILRESISIPGVFPGYKHVPLPQFDIYTDMSGSISDDQALAFFKEILAIQKKLKATITLHQFDEVIHNSEIIEKQIPKIKRVACGGTNFQCCVDHARKNGIKNIIIMTDGLAPEVNTNGLNVLWVLTKNHKDHLGKKIVIEN